MIRKFSFTMLILFFTAAALVTDLKAMDISAGATTWYTWWDVNRNDNVDIDIDPGFLYGPVLSVNLDRDFGLNLVFLYGQFDVTANGGTGNTYYTYERYDSDTSFSYRIGTCFKLFGGVKYMALELKEMDSQQRGFGPGAGLSCVLPLGKNLFLLGNVSLMYLWGELSGSDAENAAYKEYGINTSASLAYTMSGSPVTLSLGGRYQSFKTDYDKGSDDDTDHRFYGITASAVYSFKL